MLGTRDVNHLGRAISIAAPHSDFVQSFLLVGRETPASALLLAAGLNSVGLDMLSERNEARRVGLDQKSSAIVADASRPRSRTRALQRRPG